MTKQPEDACDWVLHDMDFRFHGAGPYGGPFNTQFYLDAEERFHRDDGPAYSDGEGNRIWFQHGLRHRAGGLPALEGAGGERAWYENGVLHREAGPAWRRADGSEEWWIRGERLADAVAEEYQAWLAAGGKPSFAAFQADQECRQALEDTAAEMAHGLRSDIRVMKPPKFAR